MHDGNNVRAKSVPAARKYVNSTYEYSMVESISHVSVTIYLEPNVFFNMDPKKLLSKLSTDQQEYYIFLAKECFSGFSNAEYNFRVHRYASCYARLVHASEFFWKSLTILSGNYFELKHEASQTDMAKISNVLLSNDERAKAYNILSQFTDIRRDLARYGYYEKGTHVTASPIAAFNRENTESDLNEVSWLNLLNLLNWRNPLLSDI